MSVARTSGSRGAHWIACEEEEVVLVGPCRCHYPMPRRAEGAGRRPLPPPPGPPMPQKHHRVSASPTKPEWKLEVHASPALRFTHATTEQPQHPPLLMWPSAVPCTTEVCVSPHATSPCTWAAKSAAVKPTCKRPIITARSHPTVCPNLSITARGSSRPRSSWRCCYSGWDGGEYRPQSPR